MANEFDIAPNFVNPSYATPEQVASMREYAKLLMGQTNEPVKHWTQGVANMTRALMGGLVANKANEADRADTLQTGALIKQLLGGQGGQQPQIPAAQVPAPQGQTSPVNPVATSAYRGEDPGQFNALDAVPGVKQAFLGSLYKGEAPAYNSLYGGGTFNSFADHPRQNIPITNGPYAGQTSSAAGAPQFLAKTWDDQRSKLGLQDFSPKNQDAAAWNLATETYKTKTGGNLADDLQQAGADPQKLNTIATALSGIWPSLPGGNQPNQATGGFANRMAMAMQPQEQPGQSVSGQQPIQPPGQVPGQPPQVPPQAPQQPVQVAQAGGNMTDANRADILSQLAMTKRGAPYVQSAVSSIIADKPQFGTIGHDQFGNPQMGWIDPNKRTITQADPVKTPGMQGQQTPQSLGTGEEFLKTIDKPIADQVKALAEGRMNFPAGFALKSPYWQKMIQMVSQYDPSFDAVNYNARAKTRADFTSGKSAQNITALNTVVGHLESLSEAADKLGNTDYPIINNLKNLKATATGDPRIKQFDTTKKAVVDELTRVFRGAGGSEGDIKTWSEQINSANSPQQLHGVIGQLGDLLESRINAVGEQYKQGMGTTASPVQLVTPKARTALDKLRQRATGETTLPEEAKATGTAVKVSSPEEARKLPKGTPIILPDGSQGVVP